MLTGVKTKTQLEASEIISWYGEAFWIKGEVSRVQLSEPSQNKMFIDCHEMITKEMFKNQGYYLNILKQLKKSLYLLFLESINSLLSCILAALFFRVKSFPPSRSLNVKLLPLESAVL